MAWRTDSLEARVGKVDDELATLRTIGADPAITTAVARWRADAAALRFHLRDAGRPPRVVAILGGTGTGKSTLVNRLLGANVSAASFRRTFTAGAGRRRAVGATTCRASGSASSTSPRRRTNCPRAARPTGSSIVHAPSTS